MTDEFISLGEAAKLAGISRPTLWRRIQQGGIQVYQAQEDRRIRLVKRSEIVEMMKPRPIEYTPVAVSKIAA